VFTSNTCCYRSHAESLYSVAWHRVVSDLPAETSCSCPSHPGGAGARRLFPGRSRRVDRSATDGSYRIGRTAIGDEQRCPREVWRTVFRGPAELYWVRDSTAQLRNLLYRTAGDRPVRIGRHEIVMFLAFLEGLRGSTLMLWASQRVERFALHDPRRLHDEGGRASARGNARSTSDRGGARW